MTALPNPLLVEAQDLVVLSAIEAFHRTGVNAEQCGAGKEVAQRNIGLVARPGITRRLIHAFHDAAHQHVAKRSKGFDRDAPCGGGAPDKRVHIGFDEIPFCSEYDQM